MLKNYFKIAFRNLNRNKGYSLINIAGLSIGLACVMLIVLYVKDEASYDRFHHGVPNIYRIVSQNIGKDNKGGALDGSTGLLQGPRFTQNIPGIRSFVRVQSWTSDIKIGSEIKSQELLCVDSVFFTVFSFPLLNGDPVSCLKDPYSIVLSEDAARRQFGATNVVGKTILLKQDTAFIPYQVTAVAKKVPQNSSIKFDVLVPIRETPADAQNSENWFNFFLNTFVVLDPKVSSKAVEARMQRFYEQDSRLAQLSLMERYGEMDWGKRYFLQPFLDMHMNTDLPAQNGLTDASNPVYSYILSGIAVFILLIACINFVNLTVARSVRRAKEIGIRKVVGGDRRQLVTQFLGESFFLCAIAFTLALGIVHVILPVFNQLSNKALALFYLLDWKLVISYLVLFLLTGLLAGFYPALVLSGYHPVTVLYNRFNLAGKSYLQKSLVVLQFALASFLIIATFALYSQFRYLTSKDLGYDDSHLVVVNTGAVSHDRMRSFQNELKTDPNIIEVGAKNAGGWGTVAKLSNDSTIQFAYETVDESYLPTLKIPIVAGRNFSRDFPSDSNRSILVNEAFVKKAGWSKAIGQTVNFWYHNTTYTVVGIVKDHHFEPLNQKIGPQLFTMKNDNLFGIAAVKIRPGSESSSLRKIQATFRKMFPLNPYTYVFKDQQNRMNYEAEDRWKKILLFGAVLTIFISCIGLFGLSVQSAEKRTKEIGIRKVMGASVQHIVAILSTDFLRLVLIALLIAIPVAWIAAGKWLQNYPYRITLEWWLFFSAAILVIIIALFTVSFQAVRAAIANPVKNLRTE